MDKIIRVASREALLTRDYIDDLGDWLRGVPGSREAFTEQATDALYAFAEWGGSLLTGEGERIAITAGIFDAVHSECSDGEWISEQRRRRKAERAPRKTLLGRLRLYDGLARLCSRPIGRQARREYVEEVRGVLRSFSPVIRARYVHEAKKLRSAYRSKPVLLYGAAIHRLRVRFALEQTAWRERDL